MPSHLEIPRPGDDPAIAGPPPRPADSVPAGLATLPAGAPATPPADPATLPASASTPPGGAAPPAALGPKRRRARRQARRRWDAPAWLVSALIHVGILGSLAAVATTSGEVARQLGNLDSALVTRDNGLEEPTKILADPADVPRDQAVGSEDAEAAGPSSGSAGAVGSIVLKSSGRALDKRTALPTAGTVAAPSNLSRLAMTPTSDLSSGGVIGGDVTNAVGEVGEALSQIAREILRHISQHRVVVVWMFDESESMRDDQKAIKAKFDRVVNELKLNAPDEAAADREAEAKGRRRGGGPPLAHAIVGFGEDVHFEQEKPTADIDLIGRAIDRLRIDTTGTENTMGAIARVIDHYDNLITADRKLLIVLATDESGDDGGSVEEARQAALKKKVPIYIIGRQALFGTDHLTINYTDPVTKDVYHVGIRRGPETADLESLQYDGLHRRWDEIPSGFGPYELARLAKDTGGIYFLLPSEEELRIRHREKAYSIADLKEYVPDYESRAAYAGRREGSELRRTLREVIAVTQSFPYRHRYPVIPDELIPALQQELPVVTVRLNALIAIEKKLRSIEKLRDREPEKRWQAAYDLMLAQVVAYQIKAYEYRANLQEMAAKVPQPKALPTPELTVEWSLDHSHEAKAPKEETGKVYAEALRLLKLVIERHPHTPWADLAQDEIDRGFSIKRTEHHHKHSRQYQERAKLVPKF